MSAAIGWLITALVAVLLLAFLAYVVGLRRLPTAERPRTPTYNRFGEIIGLEENPDYHVSPGEDNTAGPAIDHRTDDKTIET